MKTFEDLFLNMLKDIYYAEKQLVKALAKMAKKSTRPELQTAFENHREETLVQIERLEQIFEMLSKRAKAETCEAIQGILEEGKEVMEEFEQGDVLDAGLIASGQAAEHYEMARYGTLHAWAQQLGYNDAVPLLAATLAEEKKADQLLSKLATSQVNAKAKAA